MLYLDCASGMSGDMFVGALAALGADERLIKRKLKPVAKVSFSTVRRQGVAATKFNVGYLSGPATYQKLAADIRSLRLNGGAERLALRILRILAEAEAKVHCVPLRRVHLHEAADSVVDASASALALQSLGLLGGPVASSIVSCGSLAPATYEIIREYGVPVKFRGDREILTPTGAAILAATVTDWGVMEYSKPASGAGGMRLPWPNVVKAAIVKPLVVLESNVDDCTPEELSHMTSSLISSGALDVHVLPCMMKKGRLGFLVRVLSDDPEVHAKAVMEETGSIGVRVLPIERRFELQRVVREVSVVVGGRRERVRIKFTPLGYKPEFDDVSAIARRSGLPFRVVGEKVSRAVED